MKSGIPGGGFYTAGLYAVGSLEYFSVSLVALCFFVSCATKRMM